MIVKICLSAWQVLEIDSLGVSKGLLQKISLGNYGLLHIWWRKKASIDAQFNGQKANSCVMTVQP